jgi:Protein of unknown function (DUF1295)
MTIADALLLNAGLIAVTMIALWLISVIRKDASIVDIFWGLGFGLIAGATFAVSPGGAKPIALTCLTVVWGLRLSGYIAWRNHGKGEDPRYQAMRAYRGASFWWISLFTVFGLQGAVMWLVSLPVQVGQLQGPTLSAVSYLGIAVGAVGFLFESLGDFQLAKFKSNVEIHPSPQLLWKCVGVVGSFPGCCHSLDVLAGDQSSGDDIFAGESLWRRITRKEPRKPLPRVSRLHAADQRFHSLATQVFRALTRHSSRDHVSKSWAVNHRSGRSMIDFAVTLGNTDASFDDPLSHSQ